MRHFKGQLFIDRKDCLDARSNSCTNIGTTDIGSSQQATQVVSKKKLGKCST